MTFLGLIPARGGSKRVIKKNIINMGGRPLIAHTINTVKNCVELKKILVSTDDDEIQQIVSEYGIDVHRRPQQLATDHASAISVLKYYFELYDKFENIVYLQPTSPFRSAESLSAAIKTFKKNKSDVLVSVCKTPHSLNCEKQFEVVENGFILPSQKNPLRAQEVKQRYHRNGPAILIVNKNILHRENIYDANVSTFLMNKIESLDIDDEEDLFIARAVQTLRDQTN